MFPLLLLALFALGSGGSGPGASSGRPARVKKGEAFDPSQPPAPSQVGDFFEDDEGVVWLARSGGTWERVQSGAPTTIAPPFCYQTAEMASEGWSLCVIEDSKTSARAWTRVNHP